MAHSRKPDMKYNESGCIDKTAYAAINRIRKDERKKIIYEMKWTIVKKVDRGMRKIGKA